MRPILFLFLSVLYAGACAADLAQPTEMPPPPLDKSAPADTTPPPSTDQNGPTDEPQVTITKKTDQTVEEYRVGGRLYMIKIIPKYGKPYYLVDDRGDGQFTRMEGLDSGVRPPQWVIHRF